MPIFLLLACAAGKPAQSPDAADTGMGVSVRDSTPDSAGGDSGNCEPSSWYADLDADGWGAGEAVEGCESPAAGWTTTPGDCDDTQADTYPGASWEPCGGGIDRNCDGVLNGSGSDCEIGTGADWVIEAEDESWVGFSADWLDADGDGRSDVAIGDPGDECANYDDPGYVYILSPDALADREVEAPVSSSVVIEGTHEGWCFGKSISRAGDVDADGLEDLVVGEPALANEWDYWSNPDPGRVYVFLSAGLGGGGTVVADAAQAVLGGADPYDAFGGFVGPAGDVDGDGYADVLADGLVSHRLLLGASTLGGDPDDAIWLPAHLDRQHRRSGDVDGDGLDDIVMIPDAVLLGDSSLLVPGAILDAADMDFQIVDGLTNSILVRDVDGDGLSELRTNSQSYYASAVFRWQDLAAAEDPSAIFLSDAYLTLEFSWNASLDIADDMDGDGLPDIVTNEGGSHDTFSIISGAELPSSGGTVLIDSYDHRWTSAETYPGGSSFTVYNAEGDIQGDGINELLVGGYNGQTFILLDW